MKEVKKRQSGIKIMLGLIGLIRPLILWMFLAIFLGVIGYLCAIFLSIFAGYGLIQILSPDTLNLSTAFPIQSFYGLGWLMIGVAILRGVLHYGEQYCNHYIAFKLLALIRHQVFAALRKLSPAKLEVRDKGNLVSLITTDIELLEVFYAHTISPIAIAFITSIVMLIFIGQYSMIAACFAFFAYLFIGLFLPLYNGKQGGGEGRAFRHEFGELNTFILESLRGLGETIQYGQGNKRKEEIKSRSHQLLQFQDKLNDNESKQRSITSGAILFFSFGMFFLNLFLYQQGSIAFDGLLLTSIAMMSSFGPVVALSALSNNLNQTLASGERVLNLLHEEPLIKEVFAKDPHAKSVQQFTGANLEGVSFAYEDEKILKDYHLKIKPNRIIGIHGVSGSGKSTLLKLLMRFWDRDKGIFTISNEDIRNIPTSDLRNLEAYVTQETHLFKDTIGNNIAIGKMDASKEEIIAAAKKASIHDFITSLPQGYDTPVGELGDTLSGGERQRIGIARAFLHDAPFLLLDEPTSNLDSLNEGIILKSLKEAGKNKTVLLVSHRKSTMNVADEIYEMDQGRIS